MRATRATREDGAAADGVATAVLTDSMLFRRVAAFESGYPHAVLAMVQAASSSELDGALKPSWGYSHKQRIFGVLPRLAILRGDFQTLRLLRKLNSQPQFEEDPKPKFVDVMRTAIGCQRLDMLECLAELEKEYPLREWERNLISYAVSVNEGEPRVLEWLYQHLPRNLRELRASEMTVAVNRRDLESVRWLVEHGCLVPTFAVNSAVSSGSTEVLAYLYEHSSVRCSADEFVRTAERGALDILKLVTVGQTDVAYERAINVAARSGRLDIVQFFVEHGLGVHSAIAIDEAAREGHLSIVQYLHEHIAGGCTPKAMDDALKFGHLDIFRFLHENRTEGCTTSAMDDAAANGMFDTVKFLHENRTEGCTTKAMNAAAMHGHLNIVKFLHENRSEGCNPHALKSAAANRHLDVVEFFCQHRPESDIPCAMITAASIGHLDVVQIFHAHLLPHESAYPAVRAAAQWLNSDIIRFLCANQNAEISGSSFLTQAVEDHSLRVVRAVLPFSSLVHVQQAMALAKQLEREADMILAMETRAEELTLEQVE